MLNLDETFVTESLKFNHEFIGLERRPTRVFSSPFQAASEGMVVTTLGVETIVRTCNTTQYLDTHAPPPTHPPRQHVLGKTTRRYSLGTRIRNRFLGTRTREQVLGTRTRQFIRRIIQYVCCSSPQD